MIFSWDFLYCHRWVWALWSIQTKKQWKSWIICLYFCFSIKDIPAKTVTGTIAIQVQDSNDHCPVLTTDVQNICTTHDSVIVSAKDEDMSPNGPPFEFVILPKGTEGKWQVKRYNGEKMTGNNFKTIITNIRIAICNVLQGGFFKK